MKYTDTLGLILSVLGAYSLVLYLRFLLPRNAIPVVSARLEEIEAILDRAEADDALPNANEFRIDVAMYFTVVPSCVTHSDSAQPPPPIIGGAHRESPLSVVLSTSRALHSIRFDLEGLCPPFANRGV